MPDSSEIELKLALVSGKLEKARDVLGRARFRRTSIDDVYFDTPDRDLRRRGLVLRLRRDGERWLQTLKAAPTQQALVPVRGEWEVPLPAGRKVPSLDLERFDIAPLRVLMRAGLDASALAPVFRSRVTRRRGTLTHGSSEVEVALDSGQLQARGAGGRRRQRVAELEVELKSGKPEDVIDIATDLVRHASGITLVPSLRSKAERGYALAVDGVLDVARASARGFAQQVDREMSSPQALRAVLRHGLAIVVANADAVRQSPASEHVHQARVALRRMRSAIRLLDPDGTDVPASLSEGLRWLARSLGRARDWDVIAEDTLPAVLAGAALSDASRRRLEERTSRARARALGEALAAVSSRRYARIVLRTARWTMSAPAGDDATDRSIPAATLLDEAAERLFRDARAFPRLSPHKRHRVRIHAKRLRYTLDLLSGRLPERSASEYVDALASLQDSLGELNDGAVAADHLVPLVKVGDDRRAVCTWLQDREREGLARATRQLRALARRARPWKGLPER